MYLIGYKTLMYRDWNGNNYFYDGLQNKYLKKSKKIIYISGHDFQATHIFLLFLTPHHQRERAVRNLKDSLRERIDLED